MIDAILKVGVLCAASGMRGPACRTMFRIVPVPRRRSSRDQADVGAREDEGVVPLEERCVCRGGLGYAETALPTPILPFRTALGDGRLAHSLHERPFTGAAAGALNLPRIP